jgi:tripartite ATP-independent transporter DctP family solute receptor
MKKNRFSSILLVLFMLGAMIFVAACGGATGGGEDDDETISRLQAAHSHAIEHPYHTAFLRMAENVYERTNGRVIIDIQPNSIIGAERELIEGLSIGSVDLVVSSTAPSTDFVPVMGILDLPFLFNSRDAAVSILEGEIGEELFAALLDQRIIGMSWGENGFRSVTNSLRPIHTIDDMSGLLIRVQENPIQLATFTALGAQPTPMAWTEALVAFQQGAVHAQENPEIIVYQFELYDMGHRYMTLTGHVYSVAMYLMSQHTYNRLPADLREIVLDEGRMAGPYQRSLVVASEQEYRDRLSAQGMQIIEDIDIVPFRAAVAPVHADFFDQDLLNRVLEAQQ